MYTRSLAPADAARADEVLAGAAPDLRAEQLARKAAALEMKLNPEAVKARRERAKRDGQRVEARREASGNACLAGPGDGHRRRDGLQGVHRRGRRPAARRRAAGSARHRLRVLALTDLTQGRDPLDRLNPIRRPSPRPAGPRDPCPPGGGRRARPGARSRCPP